MPKLSSGLARALGHGCRKFKEDKVMAQHDNAVSMLRESLDEYLELARLGIGFKKKNGGALGYPSAVCLLSVVDTIGSYHRGDSKFTVQIDGKPHPISATSEHVFILNSTYFGCDLPMSALKEIYALMRSSLVHNAVLGRGLDLFVGEERTDLRVTDAGVEMYLPGFLARCKSACEKFLAVADKIVPGSLAMKELAARTRIADVRRTAEPRVPAAPFPAFGESAQASGMGRTEPRPKSFRRP